MGEYSILGCCVSFAVILPLIMMVWGTVLNDDWCVSDCILNDGTNNYAYALADASQEAMKLQIASCAMFGLFLLSTISAACCANVDSDDSVAALPGCMVIIGFLSYMISGILSIVACSMFASKLDHPQFGGPFYFCFIAGSIIELVTFIMISCCCFYCISNCDEFDERPTTVQPTSNVVESNFGYSAGVLPSSGQSGVVGSYEEAHVTQGNSVMYMKVIKMFGVHNTDK